MNDATLSLPNQLAALAPSLAHPRLRGAARILLGFVAAAVVLSLSGVLYETAAEAADARAYPAPGQMLDVGGYRLHLNCTGAGSPTVVIEAGWGDSSTAWSWVQPEAAKATRVCTYDRAGMGYSEAGPLPRSGARFAQELHTLLEAGGVSGPYVMVGHSMGGAVTRVFAHEYPSEVVGLVLIESMNPNRAARTPTATPSTGPVPGARSGADGLLTLPARTGLLRLVGALAEPLGLMPALPAEAVHAYGAAYVSPRQLQTWLEEGMGMQESLDQAGAVQNLGALPLIVLSSGLRTPQDQLEQADLLNLSSSSQQLFANNSGHNIQIEQPEAAVQAIRQMVEQIHLQGAR